MIFATTCTDDYVDYLIHLIRSMKKHNPKMDNQFHVFTSFDGMSQENFKRLRAEYRFNFNVGSLDCYINAGKTSVKYFSLECFSLTNNDDVVYVGADTLCLKPFDELYEVCKKIKKIGMTKEKRRVNTWNSQCMVVKPCISSIATRNSLIHYDPPEDSDCYGTEQKLIYEYFKKDMELVPFKFNVLTSEAEFISYDEIVFAHYLYKPLGIDAEKNGKRFMEEWRQYG